MKGVANSLEGLWEKLTLDGVSHKIYARNSLLDIR